MDGPGCSKNKKPLVAFSNVPIRFRIMAGQFLTDAKTEKSGILCSVREGYKLQHGFI